MWGSQTDSEGEAGTSATSFTAIARESGRRSRKAIFPPQVSSRDLPPHTESSGARANLRAKAADARGTSTGESTHPGSAGSSERSSRAFRTEIRSLRGPFAF